MPDQEQNSDSDSEEKEFKMAYKYDMSSYSITYSGKADEDLDIFISAFEDYATLRDYKNEKLVLALKSRIHNNARIYLDSIPNTERDTVEKIKALLKSHFEGDAWKWNVETKLLGRKQGHDETIDKYVSDILRWCTQLKKTDDEKLSLFVRGLKPSVRAFVFSKQPKSFKEAIDAARLAVAVSETAGESTTTFNSSFVEPVMVDAVQENTVQSTLNQLSGIVASTVKRLDNMEVKQKDYANQRRQSYRTEYPGQMLQPFPSVQGPRPWNPQQGGIRQYHPMSGPFQNLYANQRPPLRCNRCNRIGHKWRKCYAKIHENGTPLN